LTKQVPFDRNITEGTNKRLGI